MKRMVIHGMYLLESWFKSSSGGELIAKFAEETLRIVTPPLSGLVQYAKIR